jgi:3-methylfumaryl-CoA hydratase
VAQSELGEDGHQRRGGFLPPVALPRRMFAGGHLRFTEPLLIGQPLVRQGTVEAVTEKAGRSGPLVFVTARYEVAAASGTGALVEYQDLVYRDRPGPERPGSAAESGTAAHGEPLDRGEWTWGFDLATDSRLLFRFSALTYNAHRIHYDRDWATTVEHYPGLVVHGPLQAIALADLCRRHLPERQLATFRFRSLAPAFDGSALCLRGRLDGDTVTLAAFSGGAGGGAAALGGSGLAVRVMEAEATLVARP